MVYFKSTDVEDQKDTKKLFILIKRTIIIKYKNHEQIHVFPKVILIYIILIYFIYFSYLVFLYLTSIHLTDSPYTNLTASVPSLNKTYRSHFNLFSLTSILSTIEDTSLLSLTLIQIY